MDPLPHDPGVVTPVILVPVTVVMNPKPFPQKHLASPTPRIDSSDQ